MFLGANNGRASDKQTSTYLIKKYNKYLSYGTRNNKEEKMCKPWNIISWNIYQSWAIIQMEAVSERCCLK